MSESKVELVRQVSARLLRALLILMGSIMILFVPLFFFTQFSVLPFVLLIGALGAFISLQRRLKSLSIEDLQLFVNSMPYTWLAPCAGAVLAAVLYLLFISGLLAGDLFPKFDKNSAGTEVTGFVRILQVYSDKPSDYGKLLFWCFLAGYSEKFVTDIIGRFEATSPGPAK